ncbi:DUF3289 family protein [Paramixta manurensis]|uniref:DUF3289 family protein n=1 Tax=Paramixta manurensis TaxID=2740817 RepID=A0A6M8UFC4_9GAMM|nr:DUF3289 family protein [Erwiniaceae bacterium PD-1]
MAALRFPCTIFKTQKWMDDYGAKDMRCGDLTETELKRRYHLVDVSTRVDPYSLTKITPFRQPQSMFYGARGEGEKMTRRECARVLFDEFRHLSQSFTLYGPYKFLIEKMITHMQNSNGTAFRDMALDRALKEHIVRDSTKNSTRLLLKDSFDRNIDWVNNIYPAEKKGQLRDAILSGRLPKFDRLKDHFNGMGITVHDIWSMHITIKSLHIADNRYRAVIHYKVQDHFGLDSDDISNFKFYQFRFFRIWFVLQRYNQFGFKPFMVNMDVSIEITGERNENKK